jgi:deoxyribodipyrimidine photo-lyase
MPPKRKLAAVFSPHLAPVAKKITKTNLAVAATGSSAGLSATTTTQAHDYDNASTVDRKFYPSLLSNAKCVAYASGSIPRPIDELTSALSSTATAPSPSPGYTTVVHWFRTDLRIEDNTALHLASDLAAAAKGRDCCVVGLYVLSPQDFDAHVVSPARVDFILRSLEELKRELGERKIPLWIESVEKRRDVVGRVVQFAERWGAGVVVANREYEVDELRRDARAVVLGRENGVEVRVVEDTCVVAPGELVAKVCVAMEIFHL